MGPARCRARPRVLRPLVLSLLLLAACRSGGEGGETVPVADAAPVADQPFCAASQEFLAQLAGISRAAEPGHGPQVMAELDAFLARAAEGAPPAVRPDLATVAAAVSDFHRALASVQFDPTRLTPETTARLSSPEFSSAAARVADFSRRSCHG